LVDSDIEEVELEVGKLEDEALDEHRVLEVILSFVVLELGGVDGDITELEVEDHGHDCLCNSEDHVHVAFGVTESTGVS